jgi:hypothetical protein
MKHNLFMLAVWVSFGFLTHHLMGKHDAPDWANDIFVFIAFSFGLLFIQQFISDVMKELD